MSGNSADSFSEDSEVEGEKEEVKEKTEVMVKKKGPGRPPRKKRGPLTSSVNTSVASVHKRRCIQPKSGNLLCFGVLVDSPRSVRSWVFKDYSHFVNLILYMLQMCFRKQWSMHSTPSSCSLYFLPSIM